MPNPFIDRPLFPPFQRPLWDKVNPIRDIIDKGLIIDSPDIGAKKQPDGRVQLYLKRLPLIVTGASKAPPSSHDTLPTFTDFYCNSSTGSNLNAGSADIAPIYTTTNGNWNQTTRTFTPTDGTNPVAAGVAVGQFVSIYVDGSTSTGYVARITSVTNAANGPFVTDATAFAGSSPTTSATLRSARVGGVWKGPNANVAIPFGLTTLGNLKDIAGHTVRINFKNNATYSMTTSITNTNGNIVVQGYSTTLGDGGKATITSTSPTVLTANAFGLYIDLIFNSTASAGTTDLVVSTASFSRCVFYNARGSGLAVNGSTITECEAYNCNTSNSTGKGGFATTSSQSAQFMFCYSHGHSTGVNCHGYYFTSTGNIINCIADSCAGDGVHGIGNNAALVVLQCDFYNNTGDAVAVAASGVPFLFVENSNFLKNGRAINNAVALTLGFIRRCGYGSGSMANTNGDVLGLVINEGQVIYGSGVTPWVAEATGDFSIDQSGVGFETGRGTFTETLGGKSGTQGAPNIGAA